MKKCILTICILTIVTYISHGQGSDGVIKHEMKSDLLVYGATAAGINAAVATAREGYSVIIVEPFNKIGGLMGTGFRMAQDVPYADHLGGLTGEFYRKDTTQVNLRHKQGAGKFNVSTFQEMLNEYEDLIRVIKNYRLTSVKKENGMIKEAIFEYAPPDKNGVPIPERASDNLTKVIAEVFIDASYEGDLMAYSGVSYRVGKESNEKYEESLAGVLIDEKFPGVDPYKEKGNPESGLLYPLTHLKKEEGEASEYFMLYNFKLAWEDNPTTEYPGFPIGLPATKNEDIYELLRRYVDAGYELTWPEENFNRPQLMTGSIPGSQVNYPDGDWETRSEIWQTHVDHVRTLNDFTGKEVRLLSNQNESTNGWPHLYIRQGRRMIGEYVMTQQDIQLQTDPPSPIIGMGYYKIDVYPNQLVVLEDGTIAYEGQLWILANPGPYQIPYGAITPEKEEATNLLVPLCMSASHIAYSSIRMEATYMVMGESAGIAASLALKNNQPVQDIDPREFTSLLKKYDQILEWDGKGYRMWRYNYLSDPVRQRPPRWETHPEEYSKYPVNQLWKD
ncbi:FAD-dependent oxidoreductase [Rhodohalobacter sp. 614A]|uniref:FAD-dependent oxidoreductase n=1 Tax=Rhodohalobacter sp. 614A TaxID=2908649 RepID=UPI001F26F92A|nr:FAD-dependent oxidoreductase [Rhodohalobacter sp. 614A]